MFLEPYKKYRDNYLKAPEILKQSEPEYFVLIYWTTCPHCIKVSGDINEYLANENHKVKMYLCDFTSEEYLDLFKDTQADVSLTKQAFVESYSKDSEGAISLANINYYYVPMLLHIKNKAVFRSVVLEDNISRYIREYE